MKGNNNKSQHIIVSSHRRSGTHLTIDSIINNFDIFSNNPKISSVTLDHLSKHVKHFTLRIEDLKTRIGHFPCILKTHTHGDIQNFIGSSKLADFVNDLFTKSKIIYVHRDGRDTLTSLYHYQMSFDKSLHDTSFADFLKMKNNYDSETYQNHMDRASYWTFHVNSWICRDNVLLLSFDEFKINYHHTLKKISEFIGQPLKESITEVVKKSNLNGTSLLARVKQKLSPDDIRRSNIRLLNFARA